MTKVAIAADSKLAANIGAEIIAQGGNAIDAALAATLTSMCCELGVMAPGGSGFIAIWPQDREPVVIDAYAAMPGKDFPGDRPYPELQKTLLNYGGGIYTGIGYGAVAVPGMFAGIAKASAEYGQLSWAELITPVAKVVEQGSPISRVSGMYLEQAHAAIFGWHPESYQLVHPNGKDYLKAGEIVRLPGLAKTLKLMADEGPDCLYQGTLAQELVAAMERSHGAITQADLASYEAIIREPIRLSYGDWEIVTNPAPAVGGACLAALLLLQQTRQSLDHKTIAAIQEAVLNYRFEHLNVDQDRWQAVTDLLHFARTNQLDHYRSSPSTIHVSTVDDQGCACSLTASAGYGSGAVIPGRNFWLNNSLGELELHREQSEPIASGTRLISNMAPTIARHRNGSVLSIGSPGASRITTAIAQSLTNFIVHGDSLSEAIRHPRLHVEAFDDQLMLAYEEDLRAENLLNLSMPLREFPPLSMYFGGVQAALWSKEAQQLQAIADPRREGSVAFA
ncbi:gamma-glutamyltransferase [Picosynechococcus sp. PCC 73109]|uniref:gamma-glutamyltransferase n=1 Tax=Picosynechococcus sp. PCC 73109 TaxID=374982 RepID=UPI0007458DDB|nr:gamma-glutamyltransferase [Picosynechococcus sp. PCC 73109]AMA10795.1 gamma-glutamyltransferase [Picosynechococcus sp. PCC 73109]